MNGRKAFKYRVSPRGAACAPGARAGVAPRAGHRGGRHGRRPCPGGDRARRRRGLARHRHRLPAGRRRGAASRPSSSRVRTTPSASPSCTPATPSAWTRTRTRPYARSKDASLLVALRAVADGRADAIVSAGNTGRVRARRGEALRAAARRPARGARVRLPAHDRVPGPGPARAAARRRARRCAARPTSWCSSRSWAAPTRGASRRCRTRASGCSTWGREDGKGGPTLVEANRRLRAQPMIDFVGNVEGNDLVRGTRRRDRVRGLRRQRRAQAARGRVGGARSTWRRRPPSASSSGASACGCSRRASSACTRSPTSAATAARRSSASTGSSSSATAARAPARVANAVKVAAKAVRDRVPAEIARRDRRCALTLAPPPVARAGRGAAAALPLGSRQDLSPQRVRHPAPALADRARARRGQGRGARRHRAAEGAARRRRPARPRRSAIYFVSASPPQIGQAIRDKLRARRRAVRRHRLQGSAPAPAARQVRQAARARRLQAGRAVPRAAARRGPARASCSSATTGSPTRSRTRSTPTSSTARSPLDRARAAARCASASTRGRAGGRAPSPRRSRGAGGVERIFINLERRTPPASFALFGPRAGADLQLLPDRARAGGRRLARPRRRRRRRAAGWSTRAGYTQRRLENSLADLVRRRLAPAQSTHRLTAPVRDAGAAAGAAAAARGWRACARALAAPARAPPVAPAAGRRARLRHDPRPRAAARAATRREAHGDDARPSSSSCS